MSNPRYGSGRKQFVGQGIEADLGKLDPAAYIGAVAYSEGELYYSNGSEWVVPQDEVDISRPRNQSPLNAQEQTQLRISDFASPTGQTQTGIIYEINTDGEPSFIAGANVITRTVTSPTANLYSLLYPDDGFVPGDTIWWRAKYTGSGGTQSQFSLPTAQIYPDLIATPSPVTRVNAIVGEVEVTPFDSPTVFGLTYFETQTEFYTADGVTLLTTVTQFVGAITQIPSIPSMPEGATYVFRSRYGGRVNVSSPVVYSNWSAQRAIFSGAGSMLLEFNLDVALSRTVNLCLGTYDATGLNVTVNWGDGTSNTYTTGGTKSKVYAAGVGPIVNVAITGAMRQFGGNVNMQGLKRVDNWGFRLGLTSLREALRNATTTLEYVSPNLPNTVTSLEGAFRSGVFLTGVLDNLNTINVQNFTSIFSNCAYLGNLAGWDTSNVTNLTYAFSGGETALLPGFNNNSIATWNTSKVTTIQYMAQDNYRFNVPIGNWNMSSVTNMFGAFSNSTGNTDGGRIENQFNQPLANWNTGNVTNMQAMFYGCGFNQPIGTWNVSKVTNMVDMFSGWRMGGKFNQNIGAWDVSSVVNMAGMFGNATSVGMAFGIFNNGGSTSINNWNVSNVVNMSYMFAFSTAFNQPIGNWNVSKVTNMSNMFRSAAAFNQNIGAWNLAALTLVSPTQNWNQGMFFGSVFNNGGSDSIKNWRFPQLRSIAGFFSGATAFNQPIGEWDLSQVTAVFTNYSGTINGFLGGASSFNQDISALNFKAVTGNFNNLVGPGLSNGFYSKFLTSLGNQAAEAELRTRTMTVTTLTYSNTDFSADFPGKRFANAVTARTFLTNARSVSVAGASDTTANGTYLYNATNLTYVNSTTTWYFIRVGNRWELRNGSNVVQATSNSLNADEPYKETWTGSILATATLLLAGAAWTITGDSLV